MLSSLETYHWIPHGAGSGRYKRQSMQGYRCVIGVSFLLVVGCSSSNSSGSEPVAGTDAQAPKDVPSLADTAADTGSADVVGDGGGGPSPAPTRIYVTIGSHNETKGNPPCDRILTPNVPDCAPYLKNRAATIEFAKRVVAAGAAYDLQSDWLYLQHVASCDVGDVLQSTQGKNLIQWLAELAPGQISVDPHSHEAGGYNMADVAKMLVDLGAPDSGIVGGFLRPEGTVRDHSFYGPTDTLPTGGTLLDTAASLSLQASVEGGELPTAAEGQQVRLHLPRGLPVGGRLGEPSRGSEGQRDVAAEERRRVLCGRRGQHAAQHRHLGDPAALQRERHGPPGQAARGGTREEPYVHCDRDVKAVRL